MESIGYKLLLNLWNAGNKHCNGYVGYCVGIWKKWSLGTISLWASSHAHPAKIALVNGISAGLPLLLAYLRHCVNPFMKSQFPNFLSLRVQVKVANHPMRRVPGSQNI